MKPDREVETVAAYFARREVLENEVHRLRSVWWDAQKALQAALKEWTGQLP